MFFYYSRKIYGVFDYILYFAEVTTIFYGYINHKNILQYYSRFNYMIIIIPTIKYGSTYFTFAMGVCSNYNGHFFSVVVPNVDSHPIILISWKGKKIDEFSLFVRWLGVLFVSIPPYPTFHYLINHWGKRRNVNDAQPHPVLYNAQFTVERNSW